MNSTEAPELPRTELRHTGSEHLDAMPPLELLQLMNDEDATVAAAVREALPVLAELVDAGVEALRTGRSIHYFGAGTSGRLAVLDAAELVPTFSLEPGRVVAHIAGGPGAVTTAVEGSEDSVEAGEAEASALRAGDVAVGVAASGATPYVAGALLEARRRGALTALITSNPHPSVVADLLLVADTGPEVLTGSTRLKAGTAAKLLLNGFSTAVMIRCGRAWSNLMVSLVASNAKLRDRSVRILVDAADLSADDAGRLLAGAGGDLKTALVSHLGGVSVDAARGALSASGGSVREALDRALGARPASAFPAASTSTTTDSHQ